MSDLQCPAVVVLLTPETVIGCDLRERRVSSVVVAQSVAAGSPALAAAIDLAAAHACPLERATLVAGDELVERIEELADLYRGETVAIVADGGAVRQALELLAPPARPLALAVDSSGRRLLPEG